MKPPLREACLRFGLAQMGNYDLLANMHQLADWGYDYGEASIARLMAASDADFTSALDKLSGARSLPIEATNALFPPELRLLGPEADRASIDAYLRKAFARAQSLGVKVIGFGSGAARSVPDRFSAARARADLRDLLRFMGEQIERGGFGFVIAFEALCEAETNMINQTFDACELVLETDHPKVGLLCDLYHLTMGGEHPRILQQVKERLVHTHIANPANNRAFPLDPSESAAYGPFFENLRAIGYRGRLSIEANSANWTADAPVGLATLEKLWSGPTDLAWPQ